MGNGIRVTAREVGRFAPPPRTILTGDLADTRYSVPVGIDLFIDGLHATEVDFSGLRIWGLTIVGSTFEHCDFSDLQSEMVPSFGSGTRSLYRDCHFDRIKFADFSPIVSRFEGCSFEQVEIRNARIELAEFVDCTFSGLITNTVFSGTPYESGAKFLHPPRSRNEFRGNDFSHCRMRGVDFRHGIDVDAQRWPEGPEYVLLDRLHDRLRAFRAAVERWPDGPKRKNALSLHDKLNHGFRDQNGAFLQQATYSSVPVEYRAEIWGLLQNVVV